MNPVTASGDGCNYWISSNHLSLSLLSPLSLYRNRRIYREVRRDTVSGVVPEVSGSTGDCGDSDGPDTALDVQQGSQSRPPQRAAIGEVLGNLSRADAELRADRIAGPPPGTQLEMADGRGGGR
jgi:hypothetical protein